MKPEYHALAPVAHGHYSIAATAGIVVVAAAAVAAVTLGGVVSAGLPQAPSTSGTATSTACQLPPSLPHSTAHRSGNLSLSLLPPTGGWGGGVLFVLDVTSAVPLSRSLFFMTPLSGTNRSRKTAFRLALSRRCPLSLLFASPLFQLEGISTVIESISRRAIGQQVPTILLRLGVRHRGRRLRSGVTERAARREIKEAN